MIAESNRTIKPIKFYHLLLYIFIFPLITMCIYIGLSLAFHDSVPTILLFFISAVLFLFPLQLYTILRESKLVYHKFSLVSALQDQKDYPFWMIILLGMVLFGFAGLMSLLIIPIESAMFSDWSTKVYTLIPKYFNWNDLNILSSYSKLILIITGTLFFILNGFFGPIVEELYFRGFLTPKIRAKIWLAPLIITVLFSLYHFWLPFNIVFRIVAFYPAFYLAWKLQNIKISIVFHCVSNIYTAIMFFVTIMAL